MPKIETIKASDAPPPPKNVSKATAELLAALTRLKKDEVLKLTPDDGKSIRGLKTSMGRVASNAGIKVVTWSVDDETLYVARGDR